MLEVQLHAAMSEQQRLPTSKLPGSSQLGQCVDQSHILVALATVQLLVSGTWQPASSYAEADLVRLLIIARLGLPAPTHSDTATSADT